MVDLLMDHNNAKEIVEREGWEGFVAHLEQEYRRDFFSCSKDWLNNNKYICKLKGTHGDLVIGWIGVHDNLHRGITAGE